MKLILVHGSGGSGDAWYFQKQRFPDLDAVDLPGHPDGNPFDSVEGYVDWLHGYVQKKGYKEVVLGGHSLGGAIAQLYAVKYPEDLKALILIGTGARLRVAQSNFAMVDQNYAEMVNQSVDFPNVPAEVKAQIKAKRLEIGPGPMKADFTACDRFDIMDRLKEINLPTLVIAGTADVMTPLKYGQFLANNIAGAKLVVIEGASHSMALEKPEDVNAAIGDFLERLPK